MTTNEQSGSRPIWLGEEVKGTWDHVRVHRQLLEDKRIGGIALSVYMGLALHAAIATGEAYPSIKTLTEYTLASRNTVRKSLHLLEELGYIRTEFHSNKPSSYWLLPVKVVHKGSCPDHQTNVRGSGHDPEGVNRRPSGGSGGDHEQEPRTRSINKKEKSSKFEESNAPSIVAREKEIKEREQMYDDCSKCGGEGAVFVNGQFVECECHRLLRA